VRESRSQRRGDQCARGPRKCCRRPAWTAGAGALRRAGTSSMTASPRPCRRGRGARAPVRCVPVMSCACPRPSAARVSRTSGTPTVGPWRRPRRQGVARSGAERLRSDLDRANGEVDPGATEALRAELPLDKQVTVLERGGATSLDGGIRLAWARSDAPWTSWWGRGGFTGHRPQPLTVRVAVDEGVGVRALRIDAEAWHDLRLPDTRVVGPGSSG
jgi:hypothetical protein